MESICPKRTPRSVSSITAFSMVMASLKASAPTRRPQDRPSSAVANITSDGLNFAEVLNHARTVGGANLRKMTFHERGEMLKALAKYLMEHKKEFYALSTETGATRGDSWVDIDVVTETANTWTEVAVELTDLIAMAVARGVRRRRAGTLVERPGGDQ